MEFVKDVACCGMGLELLSELVVLTPALIGFQSLRSAQPLPATCVEPPSPPPMGGSSSYNLAVFPYKCVIIFIISSKMELPGECPLAHDVP